MTQSNHDKIQAWELSIKCREKDVFWSMIRYLAELRGGLPRDKAIIKACTRALKEYQSKKSSQSVPVPSKDEA